MPTISHATFQFARRQQLTDYYAPSSAMEVRKNCRHTASTGGQAEVYALSSRGQRLHCCSRAAPARNRFRARPFKGAQQAMAARLHLLP
jgi:hypothetical protein